MKRENLTERTIRLLTTVPRKFAVYHNNTWSLVEGTYVSLSNPMSIKCVYNGCFLVINNPNDFIDLKSYNDVDIEAFIIQKNINSLSRNVVNPTIPTFRLRLRATDFFPLHERPIPVIQTITGNTVNLG